MDERGDGLRKIPGITVGTKEEVAAVVGVAPATIKLWHQRGYLKPLSANRKPVLYRVSDVQECAFERMPKTRRDAIDALWAQLLAQNVSN